MCNHEECLLFDGICSGGSKDKDSKRSMDGAGYKILADNLLAFKKIGCLPSNHSTASMFALSYLFYLLVRFILFKKFRWLQLCMEEGQVEQWYLVTPHTLVHFMSPWFVLSYTPTRNGSVDSIPTLGSVPPGRQRTPSSNQSRHRWMMHLTSPLSLSTESHTPYQSTFTGFNLVIKRCRNGNAFSS